MTIFDQGEFEIRCEWGLHGIKQLAPISDVVIVIDVLSFTTCVSIATDAGAIIYPYRYKDDSAKDYALSLGAELAGNRDTDSRFSLSPGSLRSAKSREKIVLPSPNGSTLTLEAGAIPVLAGCLRNISATAAAAQSMGRNIAVIPSGERWVSDNSLRPALEDWLGAGAIIAQLRGRLSPEAEMAKQSFLSLKDKIHERISTCSSGKELIEKGYPEDVALATQLNASSKAALFKNDYFRMI